MGWAAGAPSAATERRAPAKIERDMARTRADLAVTLGALRHQLAPRHLVERGSDMVAASLRKMKGELDAAVRRHTRWVELLGLATGLGWLVVARRRRTRRLHAPERDIASLLRPEREPPGWLVGPVPAASAPRNDAPTPAAQSIASATEHASIGETVLELNAFSAPDEVAYQFLAMAALAVAAAATVAMLLPSHHRKPRALGPSDRARADKARLREIMDAEPADDAAAKAALPPIIRGTVP